MRGALPSLRAGRPALLQLLCEDQVALLGASGAKTGPLPAKMLWCCGLGLMQGLPA